MFAAHHAFNYSLLGERGFDAMCTLIDALDCYSLHYSSWTQPFGPVEQLHREALGK